MTRDPNRIDPILARLRGAHLVRVADRQHVRGAVRQPDAGARGGGLHHRLGVVGGRVLHALLGRGDAGAVVAQIAAREFRPFLYWATIIASTTAGTTLADFCTRFLGEGTAASYLLGSIILFGSFLAWAVYDRISVKRRGDLGPAPAAFGTGDWIALGAGSAAWLAVFTFHNALIGVRVLG